MIIKTNADVLRFPAFFNDQRYDEQAVRAICNLLMSESSHDCKPTAPLFKARFDVIEAEGVTRKMEVAIFASESKGGKPYLSCSIKPVQDMASTHRQPKPSAPETYIDDIPF